MYIACYEICWHFSYFSPLFTKLGEMTEGDNGMNPLHFWTFGVMRRIPVFGSIRKSGFESGIESGIHTQIAWVNEWWWWWWWWDAFAILSLPYVRDVHAAVSSVYCCSVFTYTLVTRSPPCFPFISDDVVVNHTARTNIILLSPCTVTCYAQTLPRLNSWANYERPWSFK